MADLPPKDSTTSKTSKDCKKRRSIRAMVTPGHGLATMNIIKQKNSESLFELEADGLWIGKTRFKFEYRHKCSACFKQYKKKEHLVEHMKVSYHSVHQPKCGVCQKHCKSFESLREHLIGQLPKDECSKVFHNQGCDLCLKVFENPISRSEHKLSCRLPAPTPLGTVPTSCKDVLTKDSTTSRAVGPSKKWEAVAIDCEMVGGGEDGSIDICARVCLVDEDENVLFHAYVKPDFPVDDYRSKVTGLTEEHLRDAVPIKEVQKKVGRILHGVDDIEMLWYKEKDTILVGYSLNYDLDCLGMNYPEILIRDTATYRPLMKTNLVSHSLKYLAKTYLGYDIQDKIHDPYEDAVSVMRLYKWIRDQDHHPQLPPDDGFECYQAEDLEKMSPDELYAISKPGYKCWCLDKLDPLLI